MGVKTPAAALLIAWLEEAEAPTWVMDGVADALPKVEQQARDSRPIAAAARRFIVAWDAQTDIVVFADSDDCYDPALEAKLDKEVDESRDALRAVLGIPDEAGIGGGPAPHGGEGSIRIWLERKRQAREEGYDAAHDHGQRWALPPRVYRCHQSAGDGS